MGKTLAVLKTLALLALLTFGIPALMGQVPNFPQTLPSNTVVGRIGTGTGPSQAIPFSTLWTRLAPFAPAGTTTPGAMPLNPLILFVSPSGSDSNNCTTSLSPCLTIEHAIDLSPFGAQTTINLAHGTYTTLTGHNIYYYRTVNITGDCGAPSQVVIQTAGNGLTAFFVQDFALSQIVCVTFGTNGTGNTVLTARQKAIVDLNNVIISTSGGSSWSGGTVINSDNSSANMGGTITLGNGISLAVFGSAGNVGLTTITANVVTSGVNAITNFFVASGKSYIKANTATLTGTGFIGTQCSVSDATIDFPAAGLAGTANSCNAFNGGLVN